MLVIRVWEAELGLGDRCPLSELALNYGRWLPARRLVAHVKALLKSPSYDIMVGQKEIRQEDRAAGA
jgi:hypothetical protein